MMIPLLCSASVLLYCVTVSAQPTTDQCICNKETDRQLALETRDLLVSINRRLQTIEDRQELTESRLLSITQLVEEKDKDTRCRLSEDGKRKCYKLIHQKMTWSESRAYCQSHAQGADLVSIETQEENMFLVDMLRDFRMQSCVDFYTSGRKDSSGTWTWRSTGRPFNYTVWGHGEPNNHYHDGSGEDALTLWDITGPAGLHWNDAPSYLKICFVCELS